MAFKLDARVWVALTQIASLNAMGWFSMFEVWPGMTGPVGMLYQPTNGVA